MTSNSVMGPLGQRAPSNGNHKRWRRPDRAPGGADTTRERHRRRFDEEVRRALRCVDRPDLLLESALLASRWIEGRRRVDRARSLVGVLHDVCEAVRDEDGDLRGYDALRRTYLRPAVKQLVAADDLGMSFGTYRRALTAATERVVERLWVMECSAPSLRLVRADDIDDDVPHCFRQRVGAGLRELGEHGALDDEQLEAQLRRHRHLFAASPLDEELDRVVQATFFEQGGSQAEIAAQLGMAYGSYRRYLARAVHRLATVLWFESEDVGARRAES